MTKETENFEAELDGLVDEQYVKMWNDEIENMDPAGLNADELNNLVHTLLARRLVEALRNPEKCSPGILQSALRFCKDNEISSLPVPGTAQEMLQRKLGSLPFEPRLAGNDK